jgi:hypothetical protein
MTAQDGGRHVRAGSGAASWFLGTRMTVLADGDLSDGRLALAVQESPAGSGPPRHRHETEDEAIFVIDDALHIECGDRDRITLRPRHPGSAPYDSSLVSDGG